MKTLIFTKYWLSINFKRVGNSIKLPTLLLMFFLSQFPLYSFPLFPSYDLNVLESLRLLPTGYGPEDIVVDSLNTPPRLLVSCASRRLEHPAYGEIEAIDPAKGKRFVMKRIGEPGGLTFRPHGISLVKAGLIGMGNRIFVSAALENKLYSYRFIDGQLTDKEQVCRIKGPDNIRIHNDNLIITSHSKTIKFIRHTKNKSRKSPSLVLSVNPRTGISTQLFYDNGKLISAASVALIFNNQLVIGQIFEPYIGLLDIHR